MVNENWQAVAANARISPNANLTDREDPRGAEDCLPPLPPGEETILLVEDEDFVRDITREVLEMSGYKVLEASNASTGMRLFNEHGGGVQLLLTDIVMPGMSGHDLAQRLSEQAPHLKTIYMSGYPGSEANRRWLSYPSKHYLQKPFTVESLTRKVREVLDMTEVPAAVLDASASQQPAGRH